MQEIAVIKGLQPKIPELQVPARVKRLAQLLQIKGGKLRIKQLGLDSALDKLREILGVALFHLRLRNILTKHFVTDGIQQQP